MSVLYKVHLSILALDNVIDVLGVGLFYNTPSIMINDFFYFYFMFILFAMLRIVMI